ncbi:MAG: hypothetical protein Q7V17_09855 [Afipia sp.]|nr:hypothetical protein [Afipia sp.]
MTLKSLNNGHTTQFACVCVVRERYLGEIDPADADGAQDETGLNVAIEGEVDEGRKNCSDRTRNLGNADWYRAGARRLV